MTALYLSFWGAFEQTLNPALADPLVNMFWFSALWVFPWLYCPLGISLTLLSAQSCFKKYFTYTLSSTFRSLCTEKGIFLDTCSKTFSENRSLFFLSSPTGLFVIFLSIGRKSLQMTLLSSIYIIHLSSQALSLSSTLFAVSLFIEKNQILIKLNQSIFPLWLLGIHTLPNKALSTPTLDLILKNFRLLR